ncbi:MAG: FTR1 family protein [Roseiflexaceae bacterium]
MSIMRFHRHLLALLVLLGLLVSSFSHAAAADRRPAAAAEQIRTALVAAQVATDQADAVALVQQAADAYTIIETTLTGQAPRAANRAHLGLELAQRAAAEGNTTQLAAARAQVWSAILAGALEITEQAIQRGDAKTAQQWLAVREFRHATRFSRPNADATLAVAGLAAGTITAEAAVAALRADLFDTYQARLDAALADLRSADQQGFAARRAETAALAEGYFTILGSSYASQYTPEALAEVEQLFATLSQAALQGEDLATPLAAIDQRMAGFRAAPLSPTEQARRAGQLLRFLGLVPIEYSRGVRGGVVAVDLEIREAATFRDGAAAAFADLRNTLNERDPQRTTQVADLLATLDQQISTASAQQATDPAQVAATTEQALTLLRKTIPSEWQHDSGADFDVIQAALDQMVAAVRADRYDLAESARIEAYAILESGPEAKLIVFAPEYKTRLENWFWYGTADQAGLAALIANKAPANQIIAARNALDADLVAAEQAIAGNNAPAAVATNAAVIVFREGLEAVLILASLMGSLKVGSQRALRRPLWIGTILAFVATLLTWLLAQGALTALASYGEKLEAIVSLIAIGVLLLITNWFFHDVYWKDWMANFHAQKRKIIGGATGRWVGLITLGFASVYREGFETVLFLQALVLESGIAVVIVGTLAGLIGTLAIGLVVFRLQARLPYMKMLVVTGILIGAVLLQMVGNTVHIMQVVGWLPIDPIRWLIFPTWVGFWFGLYATWEGILFQAAAAIFVIGSYFLAEHMQKRVVANRAQVTA